MENVNTEPTLEYLSSSTPSVDPVTRAVVDNILGNLPTKKEKVTLRCDVCNLEFSSQIPLDMHLQGNKHKKRVRSQEILNSLKEEGLYTNAGDAELRCELCNLFSNSSQQLQMHLKGVKHLNKVKAYNEGKLGTSGASSSSSLKRPAPASLSGTTDTDEPPAKVINLKCETCNITLNSDSQYQQHMESKKHQNKVAGIRPQKTWGPKPKPGFGSKQFGGGNFQGGKKSFFGGNVPPLNKSFNMSSGGYNNNNNDDGYYNNGGGNQGYEQGW